MDVATLTPASRRGEAAGGSCPRCGETYGRAAGATAPSFGGRTLHRCLRCGARAANGGAETRLVFTCEACGLPFLAGAILPHGAQTCPECAAGRRPPELPGREVSAAAENEVRSALSTRWRIVTSATAQPYVDRIARQVAERIDGAPAAIRVALVDTPEHRTLALPSGMLLLATGLLGFLEDEAELAFVLGHEIAHAASGEAAVRLVRLGFQATARERGGSDGLCWSDAAVDLARLGYGSKRERDADARALDALLALEYEPASAVRYLRRLADAAGRGDAAVAETIVAHPPPVDRVRRIERSLYGRVGGTGSFRVNREVFRRAAGPAVLATTLVKGEIAAPAAAAWGMTGIIDGKATVLRARTVVWIAAAVIGFGAVAAWLLR